MDLNSIGELLNTTTFPIVLVIILLVGGYKVFNKHIAPLIQSCIDSNKEFVSSLEKMNGKIKTVDEHVGNVDRKVDKIAEKIEKIERELN